MKITRVVLALSLAGVAVAAMIATLRPRTTSHSPPRQPDAISSVTPSDWSPPTTISQNDPSAPPITPPATERVVTNTLTEKPVAATNKLDRLTQIRETFRALAAGDRVTAIRAAKQITDETERETALLTLVTEWTHGELGPSRRRAHLIDLYGLEAGLGFELAKQPELAMLWANELTDGPGRVDLVQQTARGMVGSDPAAAFALSQKVPEEYRQRFSDALLAGWASQDTGAAMQWAEQLSDSAERDAAVQAIRSVAPVGIGTELRMQDGYPIINGLLPGAPAELSGQLHVCDRIVALAQGDNLFVDLHDLPLQDIVQTIRGAPNTLIQLQILPAGAAPNSTPRTVSFMRDQIKFKR
jgi:PDZ domain